MSDIQNAIWTLRDRINAKCETEGRYEVAYCEYASPPLKYHRYIWSKDEINSIIDLKNKLNVTNS